MLKDGNFEPINCLQAKSSIKEPINLGLTSKSVSEHDVKWFSLTIHHDNTFNYVHTTIAFETVYPA